MNDRPDRIITFAEFELNTIQRRLARGGETVPLHAKAFDLLVFLVENNGRVLTKDEILETVWENRFVEESNLAVQISNLRKALGESKNSSRFLVTVPGKGYRFAAATSEQMVVIETHSVSELTIEREEELVENRAALMSRPAKWRVAAAFAAIALIGVAAFAYMRFQRQNAAVTTASLWSDASRNINRRQLTANGKINVAAISPDGTMFAYTTEGSEMSGIWVSGVNGSQTIEILPPSATTFLGMTYSPGGSYIYYVARDEKNLQGALFRIPSMGGLAEKLLTNISRPVTFSPDGKQFAFVRKGGGQTTLVAANVEGKIVEREIASRPANIGFNENGAAWSPDGKKIAVGGEFEDNGENVVLLVDAESGGVEKFGDQSWTWVRRVEWSPDGTGLFINVIEKDSWQERQIWLVEYPSGKASRVTNDLNRYGGETVSVSADGRKLLGVSAQTISNIFTAPDGDTAKLTKITQNAVGKSDGAFNSLAWTPDGRLVFRRFFDKSDTLWIMNADGSDPRQLTPAGSLDRKPSISKDGKFVFFHSVRNSTTFNIWRVSTDGSDLKQLTTNGGQSPSVSPDGKWVYYQQAFRIWRIDSDGGDPVQMTTKASKTVEVSPDGTMFASFYRLTKDDKLKLAVFSIEGGEPLHLFDVPVDLNYEKLRWMPDGRSLVYAFYNSTAWRQPLTGGAPEKFLEFPGEIINSFDWSLDGKQFAVAHGQELRDVVLFSIDR